MERILVVYYSQTGQLKRILKNFCQNQGHDYVFDFMEITTPKYSFPLTWWKMFDMFPESVLQVPCKISYRIPDLQQYETIVLGFQTWFLHLSLPMLSFIKNKDFNSFVFGKKVCLIMDCRNSWKEAMKTMENAVIKNGGSVIGKHVYSSNIRGNFMGVISILNWFFTGKKKISFLPEAGVSQNEIERASAYGYNYWVESKKPELIIYPFGNKLMASNLEDFATNKFHKWANYIKLNYKYRNIKLILFMFGMVGALLFIVPFKSSKMAKQEV